MSNPYWLPGRTITNGDEASASYLTTAISVSGYASGALTIIGNNSTSTGQTLTELTLAAPLGFNGTSVTLTTAASVAQGGTNASSVTAANQSLTPATVVLNGSTGTTGMNWASGASFYLPMTSSCTIMFSNAVDAQIVILTVGTCAGSYTLTLPTVKWSSGSAPTLTTAASKYDVFNFLYNSSISAYIGTYVQSLS